MVRVADEAASGLGPDAPPQWLFSSVGGQGSRHLIDALRSRLYVGDKPDNALWHSLPAVDLNVPIPQQGSFAERAGTRAMGEPTNLLTAFPSYITWLRSSIKRTAVFGLSAEFGLFSLYRVPRVAFLFRDPVDAYVSWAKPERHGDIIAALGGLQSQVGIDYYIERWLRAALEYIKLRELGLAPHLIRYDHAAEDAAPIGMEWAFGDFRSDRTNRGVLSTANEAYIYARLRFASSELRRDVVA